MRCATHEDYGSYRLADVLKAKMQDLSRKFEHQEHEVDDRDF